MTQADLTVLASAVTLQLRLEILPPWIVSYGSSRGADMSRRRLLLPLFAFTIALSSSQFLRADIVLIDDFDQGAQSITADPDDDNVGDSASGLDPTRTLAGRRRLDIQGKMSSGSINASVDIADGGQLTFASNNPVYTSAFQGRLIITHVAGGRGATTDLSEFADFDYVIDVGSADFGPGIASYTAEFQLSSVSKGTIIEQVEFQSSATSYEVVVPMSVFANLDLTDAFNLTLDFGDASVPAGLGPDANFTIDRIYFRTASVPEPGTFWLLSGGLGLLIATRVYRRRHKSAT